MSRLNMHAEVTVGATQDYCCRAFLGVEVERVPGFPNVPKDNKHHVQANCRGHVKPQNQRF